MESKWVSIAVPVHTSPMLSSSFFQGAMDTAMPTDWMTLGTLEKQFQTSLYTVKHHFFAKILGKTQKNLIFAASKLRNVYVIQVKIVPEKNN